MRSFLADRVRLHPGDCLEVLPTLAENSVDACVTDPPYHLTSIQKRFAKVGRDDKTWSRSDPHQRHAAGFMNQKWDGGDIAFRPETWAAVLRVLKPGANLLAFGAPKNAHRLFCAIEDAGFEIRDTVAWVFGSGFPKSLDVSKAIDKAAGAERPIVGRTKKSIASMAPGEGNFSDDNYQWHAEFNRTGAATDAAREWDGWGTALKPAYEPICLARKPLSERTVVANVLRWGTGAINVDGCRVDGDVPQTVQGASSRIYGGGNGLAPNGLQLSNPSPLGRWPANLIHDGSDEVLAGFPDAPGQQAAVRGDEPSSSSRYIFNGLAGRHNVREPVGDSGSAARFFYTAKADATDRAGSKHPTVKPLDLIQYLCRLVCPPRGIILDPFAGTGTTGEAAWREGFSAILIEREPEYVADIERRMALALAGPDERAREGIKARLRGKPEDHGPLFAKATP